MEPSQYGATPKRTVLGNLNNQNSESSPISPMANLKLLIRVATSPEDPVKTDEQVIPSTPVREKTRQVSRQLRSLGFICKKFLQSYSLQIPPGECKYISLIQLSKDLEIEKRRIYDIINVVASLNMAFKVCKDRYVWYGNQHLPQCLYKLKCYVIDNKLDELIEAAQKQDLADVTGGDYSFRDSAKLFCKSPLHEDNRIGVLCQKFIVLFLVAPQGTALNLNAISKLILPSEVPDKTGMRRLYDIANVLESLGLIKRPSNKMLRKPTFVYCGPDLNFSEEESRRMLEEPIEVPKRKISCGGENSIVESHMTESRFYRLSDIFNVVSSELEKITQENVPKAAVPSTSTVVIPLPSSCSPSAKKRLFPPTDCQATPSKQQQLVKAPNHSFRVMANTITSKPQEPAQVVPTCRLEVSGGNSTAPSVPSKNTFKTVDLSKISRKISIFKPVKLNISAPQIQNGSIYKAVKNGDVIHLVKLHS